MPADTNLILTSGHLLRNLTGMMDGVPIRFTTPSVNVGSGGTPDGQTLAVRVFIPAFTNVSNAVGAGAVGAFTRPYMTVVLQEADGNPATEANWKDLLSFGMIRPHVPTGSTGAGTPSNPVYSNVYVRRFHTIRSQVRLSGMYIGSNPDFSFFHAAVYVGERRYRELD